MADVKDSRLLSNTPLREVIDASFPYLSNTDFSKIVRNSIRE
jgi:hypothetical protein